MDVLVKTSISKVSSEDISILDGRFSIKKKYLHDRVVMDDSSVLIASGSLIEGIGTVHSDIDCIVFCDERPKACDVASRQHALVTDVNYHYVTQDEEVHNTTDFYGGTSIHIDTDYITFSEVDNVVRKIEKGFSEVASDQRYLYSPILLERENNVVHRSLIGHALVNEARFLELKAKIPLEKHLYVAHREKLPVYYAFQDVQGCWQSGNLWMGCEIVRDMMFKTTMSFTYLTGATNKHQKWVYSNVYRLKGFDEIKERFFYLSRLGCTTEGDCRLYIEQVLEYMDVVFLAIENLLRCSAVYPSQQSSLNALNYEFEHRKSTDHKISTCEYFFRKKYFAAEDTPSLNRLLKEWD